MARPIKISRTFDEWASIADALVECGRAEKLPHLMRHGAGIAEAVGLNAVAASTRDEADRMENAGGEHGT